MSKTSITPTTPPEPESVALQMTTQLQGLQPTDLVLWLRQAVPHYLQGRRKLMQQSLLLGFALIVVRDHCQRGSLANIMTLCTSQGQGSKRTLQRCMSHAQDFITARGLGNEAGKLSEKADISGLFQPEFNLSITTQAGGLMEQIDAYCAERENQFEKELIGEIDEALFPPDGPKTKKRKTSEEELRARWSAALKNLQVEYATGSWKHDWNTELLKAEKWFETTLKALKKANQTRQIAEASAAKKARK
jgi:hypothetical protein